MTYHREDISDARVVALFNAKDDDHLFLEESNWKRLVKIRETSQGLVDEQHFERIAALHAAGAGWRFGAGAADRPQATTVHAPSDRGAAGHSPASTQSRQAEGRPRPRIQQQQQQSTVSPPSRRRRLRDRVPISRPGGGPLTWDRLVEDIAFGLADPRNDAVELYTADSRDHDPLLRVEFVGSPGEAHAWISLPVFDAETAYRVDAQRPTAALRAPWRLPLRVWRGPQCPVLAEWYIDDSPAVAGQRAVDLARTAMEVHEPSTLVVMAQQAPDEVWMRRVSDGHRIESVRKEVAARGPVLGHCRACGRALTDPLSAARGIGPVCEMLEQWRTTDHRSEHVDDIKLAIFESRPIRLNSKPDTEWARAVSYAWDLRNRFATVRR